MTHTPERIESFLERVAVIVNPSATQEERTTSINEWKEILGKYVRNVNLLQMLYKSEYWNSFLFPDEVRRVIEDLLFPVDDDDDDDDDKNDDGCGVVVLCMENSKVSESANVQINASAKIVNGNVSQEDEERLMKSLKNANIRIECMTNCFY